MPSSANGTFDRSIFENHLTTRAILGEVMWVASAPVNWAKSESLHIFLPERNQALDKGLVQSKYTERGPSNTLLTQTIPGASAY